jgi:plastocyanin
MRAFVLTALVLLVAGCGSESTSGTDNAAVSSLELSETEFALDPSSLTADTAGRTTIRVVNDGELEHALELEGNGVEEETDTIAPGESAELTVDLAAGTYTIYCPIGNHRAQGMAGKIVVAGGAGGGSTSTGETETDEDGYGYGKG